MGPDLLNTLVKLASLGASGVCIFAIFWIGWLILRLPSDAATERYRTLRHFMVVTVVIALISGAAGLMNMRFNTEDMAALEEKNHELEEQLRTKAAQEVKTQSLAKSLATVLASKEAYNLRNPSQEIETHIKLLKEFLKEMGVRDEPPN
jgi:formate hydrogenlyase subunit 3/multisubunit Na+/H+ antiporter MnhD subunit